MNKSKIVVFLLVTLAVGFWIASFMFNLNAPKSKAAGETMNLSFSTNPVSVAKDADFTVSLQTKPSKDALLRGFKTKIIFDKTILKFKSLTYKIGTVSTGLGNVSEDATKINTDGFFDIIGEDTTPIGAALTTATGAEFASVTFTAVSHLATQVIASDSSFYSSNTDGTLFDTWTVPQAKLDVNIGNATPIPSATGTGGGGTGNVNLNMKLKFQGITKQPATAQNSMNVKVKVYSEGVATPYEGNGTFTSDANGIWSGKIGVNITTVSGKYKIFVKGAQHLQKKICEATPTEATPGVYRCATGNIDLITGDNNLDFSGLVLLVGDLDQNGIVDSVDFGLVRNNLGKSDPAILATSDLNRDGKVDTQDFSLIIAALGVRTDEL